MPIKDTIAEVLRKRKNRVPDIDKVHKGLLELEMQLATLNRMTTENVQADFTQVVSEVASKTDDLQAETTELSASISHLLNRFRREKINIGVAGAARQGKSTLLQKISGLSDTEIPTSSGLPCTGTKSRICHCDVNVQAEIEFFSRQEFLTEILYPYFDRVNLRRPNTLQDFGKPLPALVSPGNTEEIDHTVKATYKELQRIHTAFPSFSDFLSKPAKIAKLEEVREYVTQNTKDGTPLTTYLAVKTAHICTKFPNHDISDLCLVDLPGLEVAQGHEKKLITSLEQEVDAIIFTKFPPANGATWTKDDFQVINLISNAVKEIDLDKWLFIVLNESNDSKNKDMVQLLSDRPPEVFGNKPIILKANFYDAKKVDQQIFSMVLKHFEQNLESIDRQYIRRLAEKMEALLKHLTEVLTPVRHSFVLPEGDLSEFLDSFADFMASLAEGLEDLVAEQRGITLGSSFKSKVEEVCDAAKEAPDKESPPILPPQRELEKKRLGKGNWLEVLPPYLNELRAHLTRYLAEHLDAYLKQTVDEILSQVLTRIFPDSLNQLATPKAGDDPRKAIVALRARLDPIKQPHLYSSFEYIERFNFSYHSLFHYRVRSEMELLDAVGNDVTTQLLTGETRDNIPQKAEEIARGLRHFYEKTVFQISKKLSEDMQADPGKAIFALVEEIRDRLVRTRGIEKEWRTFLYPVRGEVWPEKFKQLADKETFCKQWQTAIDEVLKMARQIKTDFSI